VEVNETQNHTTHAKCAHTQQTERPHAQQTECPHAQQKEDIQHKDNTSTVEPAEGHTHNTNVKIEKTQNKQEKEAQTEHSESPSTRTVDTAQLTDVEKLYNYIKEHKKGPQSITSIKLTTTRGKNTTIRDVSYTQFLTKAELQLWLLGA
jgi:hypothetical protein